LNDTPEFDANTSKRFSRRGWVSLCGLILILAGLSRFLFLDEKPYHHDESLHAYYSNRVAGGIPHEYSALLHGPVLYYLTGAFLAVFGSGELTARLPAALCGVLIVALPLLWRKQIGTWAAAALSIFLLFSPTMMYFGRFLREDVFNSLWICISLASYFGYRRTGKMWPAVCASAFLAMQFCNKENSYLHMFIWLTGGLFISLLARKSGFSDQANQRSDSGAASRFWDRLALPLNCFIVFAAIFVVFYSSFFRHSKGAMHGILDGLYRESLLYWWDQNQKRRIDGPFDYHSPLFFNYEFALVPALLAAWYRSVRLAAYSVATEAVRFPVSLLKARKLIVGGVVVLWMVVLFFPRIGLTSDGCSISEFCLNALVPEKISAAFDRFAHLLHVAHSRHMLQIVAVAVSGAVAFVASVALGRRTDAFLWWWATGAIGAYSYVGEKVPWLLIYILLPLFALAGLEIGRSFAPKSVVIDHCFTGKSSEGGRLVEEWEHSWVRKGGRLLAWLTAAFIVFAGWKAIRLSFLRPADPVERLVFTQTTPESKALGERWKALSSLKNMTPKITIHGEATWPFAWYVQGVANQDFIKPADAAAADAFDALFLDLTELEFAQKQLVAFDVYKIPLRHWWVPQANPRFSEILEYFLTSEPYPRELRTSRKSIGFGQTEILYLENRSKGRLFSTAERIKSAEIVALAGRRVEPLLVPAPEASELPADAVEKEQ
jgi:uncharacterized protein (TIGR03663 family)